MLCPGSLWLLLVSLSTTTAAPVSSPLVKRASLPTAISASTAKIYLENITIADPFVDDPQYDRDAFNAWITIEGNCNTREYVLRRDGEDVSYGANCYPTSGTWYSPYDGATWTDPTDVDIDHMVPLKEAWISGAWDWSDSTREAFANDVTRPQLFAVTDNENQSKGASDLAEYLPPLEDFQCYYVRSWVEVKYFYALAMDQAEWDVALEVLETRC